MSRLKNLISHSSNLKKYYYIHFEMGMILSLLFMIALFKIDFYPEEKEIEYVKSEEIVQVEEIERTRQESLPPPPPRPPVPVEVPNDEIITDIDINIDSELNIYDQPILSQVPPKKAETSEQEEEDDEIFVIVEEMPKLIGGIASIMEEIKYPELARRAKIEGRVIVEFVVDENGNVLNPRVIRGIGGGCDEEALRVVKKAKFIPGLQRGMPVKVRYNLPVTFMLMNK